MPEISPEVREGVSRPEAHKAHDLGHYMRHSLQESLKNDKLKLSVIILMCLSGIGLVYGEYEENRQFAESRASDKKNGKLDPLVECQEKLRQQIATMNLPVEEGKVIKASTSGVNCAMTLIPEHGLPGHSF